MSRLADRVFRMVFGESDAGRVGRARTLRGLRRDNPRDLYLGLGLSALAYLQRTKPRKQLIYRKTVPEGAALVIHHKGSGEPRLQIVKPKKRGR